MRVKMILDLVANTKGGARQAQRDLKGVKDAARNLDGAKGGQRISRDFLNLASGAKTATRNINDAKAATDGLGRSTGAKKLGRELDEVGRKAGRAKREIAQLQTAEGKRAARRETETGSGGTSIFAGTRGLVGGYLGIQGARMATRGTVGQSVSREKAMADVRKKVDLPEGESFEKLERTITKFSIAFGQSFENVAAIVAEAGAAGVAFEQLAGFTELATKASIAWDVPAREAAQKLFEIRAATQSTLPQLEEFADMINALGDNSAAKESSILEMFQRVGAAAKEAGVPIKTSLAFLTGIRSVGIGDEVGSRAFGALTNKLVTADRSKKGTKALKEMGLNAKAFAARMKTDATGALLSFFEALEKTPDAIGPLTDFVGNEWFDEVLRMKGAVTEIRKALALLSDPANYKGSTTKTLNVELETTANHLERLKAQASDVGDRLGRWALPAINEGIEKIIAGMDAVDKRAADKTAEASLAQKVANNLPLTAEEREKLANDRMLASRVTGKSNAISARKDYEDTVNRTSQSDPQTVLSERAQLLRRQLQRQIDTLEAELKLTPDGYGDRRKRKRLENLRKELTQIPTGSFDLRANSPNGRRPADQEERAGADRGEAMALRERVQQLEARLATIDALRKASGTPR